ncbi:MAG: FxsA family protein [Acidimicrobiia bacterium]
MVLFLVLLFVVVPLAELYVIVQVADWIGILETLVLLFAVSVAGAYLAKREGIAVWRRIVRERQEGKVPAAPLIDGVLILVGGVLLLAPGFVTDVAGILLLLPPTRAAVRAWLRHRWAGRVTYRRLG